MPPMQNRMGHGHVLTYKPLAANNAPAYISPNQPTKHQLTLVKPMKTKLTDRRDFLKTSAAATLFPAPFVRAQSKDKKYRTALIGGGWWGMNILREAMAAGESTVVAMCDVDENQLNPAAAEVEKLSGDQPKK